MTIKGVDAAYGQLFVYDEDDAEYFSLDCTGGYGRFSVAGSSPQGMRFQSTADCNIEFFTFAASTETPEFKIFGYREADSLRSLEIGVGVDAADQASFDGLSTYYFDGDCKATTFTIGANTLSTTEWAFLDGQDQAVTVAGTPQFANLGVGDQAAAATSIIKAYKSINNALATGLIGNVTNVKSAPTVITSTYGLSFGSICTPVSPGAPGQVGAIGGALLTAKFQPEEDETQAMTSPQIIGINSSSLVYANGTNGTATLTVAEMHGARFYIRAGIQDTGYSGDINITSMYGVESEFTITQPGGGASTGIITVTNAYGYFLKTAVNTGAAYDYTNLYAFYDQGQTAGTNNWGIAINTADNYINGSLRVGSAVAPVKTLDVTGAIMATDYYSGDGTQGATYEGGTAISFLDGDFETHTVTIKDGLITSWSIA